MNPLSVLINLHLKSNNLSRNNLAQLLGYKNISKGLRNLDAFCTTLLDTNNISKELPEVLNIPDAEYSKAVNQLRYKIDDKARSKFKPLIQVNLISRPSPIFILGMCPQLWHVEIPDISNCNFTDEISRVCKSYKQHLENPNTFNSNGFKYFRNYDETLFFDVDCKIIEHINSHIEPNKATLTVGGRTIPPSIIGI